jgi:hypothetical protein
MTDWNVPRDPKYNRPLLYPPEGGKRVAYSRCSTLAKDIDKASEGLFQYYQTNAMIGMARTPSLLNRVKAIVAKGGSWDRNKGEFKEICKTAETVGGATNKADRGTSIHDYAEVLEVNPDGLDWTLVEEDLKGPLDGYYEDIASKPDISFLAREVFLAVNRPMQLPNRSKITLRAAGSADRVVDLGGERKMVDIKTGKDDDFRMGVSGQLALYVEGQLYRDSCVLQEVPWAEWYANEDETAYYADHECDYDEALMFHCPQAAGPDGKWHWVIYRVPLQRGREIIRCGQWARKLRYVPEFKRVDL